MYRSSSTRYALIAAGLAVLVTLATLAAACSSPAQATPTPTRTPRPAVTAAPPTQPPATAMPSPTQPPTAAPTATPIPPTATAAPTAAPTADAYNRPANVNPLTALSVADPKLLARRPLFVAVNNDPAARPNHFGFAEADLVYEYIMEGGAVTRFSLVFLANESERIGPMRSGRLVNFYLTPQYGGALAVSGAQGQVNWFLTFKMGAPYLNIDLDDPSNLKYSFSIWGLNPDPTREYETRLWTSTGKLRRWLADKKAEQDPQLRGFPFSEQAPSGALGKSVAVPFPAKVTWVYDAASGRYLRNMSGTPHNDAATGKQLGAANVIIQTVPHEKTEYYEDANSTSIRIITVGEGPATILRDGVAIKGTWKAGDTSMPEFFDAAGKPIPLKPGNSWFELVAATDTVTVSQ